MSNEWEDRECKELDALIEARDKFEKSCEMLKFIPMTADNSIEAYLRFNKN